MAKITKSTFKSFVTRNRAALLIRCESSFDPMTDCVQGERDRSFLPASETSFPENTLGIGGIWLVNGGRDWFSPFAENGLTGIHVYNCCGSFTVAIPEATK